MKHSTLRLPKFQQSGVSWCSVWVMAVGRGRVGVKETGNRGSGRGAGQWGVRWGLGGRGEGGRGEGGRGSDRRSVRNEGRVSGK